MGVKFNPLLQSGFTNSSSGGGGSSITSVNGDTGPAVVLTANSVGAANKTLSNLTSPTAINQNLVFNKSIAIVQTADNSDASGSTESIQISSGDRSGQNGATGTLYIKSGQNNNTISGNTGDVYISSGDPNIGKGGDVRLFNGYTSIDSNGGDISLIAGNLGSLNGGYTAGTLNLKAGSGSTANDIGGPVLIQAGDGMANGGAVTILSGNSFANGVGGNIILTAGYGAVGNGGSINLTAGDAFNAGNAGSVNIMAGIASTGVNAGDVYIQSGSSDNTISGTTYLKTGDSSSDSSGRINIGTGAGAVNSGNIDLETGTAGSGTKGAIRYSTALADLATTLLAPSTGFSTTIGNRISTLVLNPAGTLATGTITLPASPTIGQIVHVVTTQTVTALTVTAASTVVGAPTTITTITPFAFIFIQISGGTFRWIRYV